MTNQQPPSTPAGAHDPDPPIPDRPARQRGSVLPLCLIVAAGAGAAISTFLGRTMVEQHRVLQKASRERAQWRSIGQLEVAKYQINHSTYTDARNDVIQQALAADPPFIVGTPVLLEEVGPERWYRLVSVAMVDGQCGSCLTYLRDGTSYVIYNYYVERHGLGVSGSPRGLIHANGTLEFYLEGGVYQDYVSAGDGFEFEYGATELNTKFLKGADASAPDKHLIQSIDFAALRSDATFVAPDGLEAEVTITPDQQVRVDLYDAPAEVTFTETLPAAGSTSPRSPGSMLGSVSLETASSYTLTIPGELVSTQTLASNGVLFFPGRIRGLRGNLNGAMTLVSEQDIVIDGNLRYVDTEGNTAWLYGSDSSEPYVPNTEFARSEHALGLIARGNIEIALGAPAQLEINACTVSTEGRVGFQGIVVEDGGSYYLDPSVTPQLPTSLRRFGTVMSARRPITTLLDGAGNVVHGFQSGASMYDRGAIISPPPSFPSAPTPYYLAQLISTGGLDRGGGVLYGGAGVWTPSMTDVTVDESRPEDVLDLMKTSDVEFDWGDQNRNIAPTLPRPGGVAPTAY